MIARGCSPPRRKTLLRCWRRTSSCCGLRGIEPNRLIFIFLSPKLSLKILHHVVFVASISILILLNWTGCSLGKRFAYSTRCPRDILDEGLDGRGRTEVVAPGLRGCVVGHGGVCESPICDRPGMRSKQMSQHNQAR